MSDHCRWSQCMVGRGLHRKPCICKEIISKGVRKRTQKEPPTCTLAPHSPYSQVPPMDQSLGRGTSNPIQQSHSHRSLQEVRLAWCWRLAGGCSRGGQSGAHGRRGHNVQEGSRHRCQRWSGTSCSLRHGASMLPLCRRWFAKSVEFLPRPLACSKPRLALDQIP